MVILSCQKSANPSRSRRKNLSRNEKNKRYNEQKMNLPKAGRHEGLKIPFWRQSTASPPADSIKTPELFSNSNDSGAFFLFYFLEALEGREVFYERRTSHAQLKSMTQLGTLQRDRSCLFVYCAAAFVRRCRTRRSSVL